MNIPAPGLFIPATGVYGPGMHDFVLDEAEVGTRAAAFLDLESCDPGWFVPDAHDAEHVAQEQAASTAADREAG